LLGFRISICLLICIFLAILAIPVFALDYNTGVVPGYYVKYGIFNTSPNTIFSDIDWMKYEVTAVSGKNVTLLNTGLYKNGTVIPGNGVSSIYNIERNNVNDLHVFGAIPIIGSNLNQGDPIPYTVLNISRTENRTYLGISRTVNVVEDSTTTMRSISVYDRTSGLWLEIQMEQTNSNGTLTASYRVIETNIFADSTIPEFPSTILLACLAASMLLGALLFKRKLGYKK
jgi:hypothetical protein